MTGTERKVFQKYYPPDFDPSKIPKAKGPRNRQFIQRVMTPFNMQCNTCHEYIYKGKKFNMRRETAEGENYLGLKIFRFYFRCPNCLAEITFKTDIENVDYQAEHGATRLFDPFKYYQEKERSREEEEEAEKQDAMKMLEKRTKMSRIEMEALGQIEELQETSRRMEKVDTLGYLKDVETQQSLSIAEQLRRQEEEDEEEVMRLCGKSAITGKYERRIKDEIDKVLDDSFDDNNGGNSTDSEGFAKPYLPPLRNKIVKGQPAEDLPSTSTASNSSDSDLKQSLAELNETHNPSSSNSVTFTPPEMASGSKSLTNASLFKAANLSAMQKRTAPNQISKFLNGVVIKKKPK